jgi:hypothetical protein
MSGPVRNPAEAFQQLEAIMLRQMLQSSGAFKAEGTTPGAQLRTDLFVETLADAVAKAGGLGIARMLEHQLGGGGAAAAAAAQSGPSRSGAGSPGGGGFGDRVGAPASPSPRGIDDLDDPNSEAALPEDPNAPSIDDFQPRHPVQNGRRVDPGQAALTSDTVAPRMTGPHLSSGGTDHAANPASGNHLISIARSLNRYRERAEVPSADTPSGARNGEQP